jgi:tRNA G18 (ribose-2'-O)-methylase SpoU
LVYARNQGLWLFAAEITETASSLSEVEQENNSPVAVVFGNEVDGVQKNTLDQVDKIVYIPMEGIKESLNIGQSAAIFMRALR